MSASASHLCQDPPSSTGCPGNGLLDFHLAYGAVLCPWSVRSHCWALFHFSSATWVYMPWSLGLGTCWENLSGSGVTVAGDR